MRVYLALVALSAGASAASVVEASTPAGVAETHAERELLTRSDAKTRQLERKLAKVKAKREKADAKVKKVEDALERAVQLQRRDLARVGKEAARRAEDAAASTDTIWFLACAALVFLMQAGFALVEQGSFPDLKHSDSERPYQSKFSYQNLVKTG